MSIPASVRITTMYDPPQGRRDTICQQQDNQKSNTTCFHPTHHRTYRGTNAAPSHVSGLTFRMHTTMTKIFVQSKSQQFMGQLHSKHSGIMLGREITSQFLIGKCFGPRGNLDIIDWPRRACGLIDFGLQYEHFILQWLTISSVFTHVLDTCHGLLAVAPKTLSRAKGSLPKAPHT